MDGRGTAGRPVEENGRRRRIEALVTEEPSITAQEVSRALGCRRSAVDHHVRRLLREGRLVEVAFGRRKALYAARVPPGDRPCVFWRRLPAYRRVLDAYSENPRANQARIARACGVSPSFVSRICATLRREGLLAKSAAP